MKIAIAILLGVFPALAAEVLKGEIVAINTGIVTGAVIQVEGYAFDTTTLATTFSVKLCWDDATYTTSCTTVVSNSTTPNPSFSPHNFISTAVVAAGTIGSVTPRDGSLHQLYGKIISQSNPGAGDVALYGSPYPFKYTSSSVAPVWTAVTESLPVARLGVADIAILANTSDTYSVGSAGTTVCAGGSTATGSTAIKSDGIAGYYAQKRSIPCNQIYEITTTVTKLMTDVTFASAISPTLTAMPSTVQVIAIAWVQPSEVYVVAPGANYANGMSSAVTNNFVWTPNTISTGGGVCMTDLPSGNSNPYFNTNSRAPFTDYAIRPSMMLAFESCSICGAASDWVASITNGRTYLDRAFTATNVNPSGNGAYIVWPNDYGRNVRARVWSSQNNAGAISSRISASVQGSASSPVANLNGFGGVIYNAAGVAVPTGTNTYAAGGVADSLTSLGGQLPFSGSQTPAAYWINAGAYGSYGTVSEPCISRKKFPWPDIFLANYTQGQTLVEAYWKSVEMPFQGNFIGDPLLTPYALAGTTVAGSKTLDSAMGLGSSKSIR